MSNITPIRQQVAQPSQQDWWGAHPEHPIWPPQGTCGPQPPSCFSQIAKADACWDQSQALYNLVSKVVMDIFQTNPGIIPSPPPSQGSGPILGVTDGSNAQPGQVGEFVTGTASLAYAANPAITQNVNSLIVLQPGDWDVRAFGQTSSAFGVAQFYLSPVPAGLSNEMNAVVFESTAVGGVLSWDTLVSATARASVKVPTLLAFAMAVNQSIASGLPAGTFTMWVEARRVR